MRQQWKLDYLEWIPMFLGILLEEWHSGRTQKNDGSQKDQHLDGIWFGVPFV